MKTKLGIAIIAMLLALDLSASIVRKAAKGVVVSKVGDLVHSCELGNASACHEAGWNYKYAEGVEEDRVKSAKYFKLGCDGGEYKSCNQLGQYYQVQPGKKEEAFRLFKLGCDNGALSGCFSVALGYQIGDVAKRDLHKAIEYYKKSASYSDADCTTGSEDSPSCKGIKECEYSLAHVEKPRPYLDKAMELLELECKTKKISRSCSTLSFVYTKGRGVDKNIPLGKKYKELKMAAAIESCKKGSLDDCINLTYNYKDLKDIKNATKYAFFAFELGDGSSLEVLAKMHSEGTGTEKNAKKAKSLYLDAAKIYTQSCEKGNGEACQQLSYMYDYGRGVQQSKRISDFFAGKGCEFGEPFSCLVIGDFEREEKAKEKQCHVGDIRACEDTDPERALRLYKEKCDANDGDSCWTYARKIKEFI